MKKRIDSVEERYRSINIGESAKSRFGIFHRTQFFY